MLVTGVSAILLVSPDASALADFYRSVLELPLEDEVHEGIDEGEVEEDLDGVSKPYP